jgi:hypothetical protein
LTGTRPICGLFVYNYWLIVTLVSFVLFAIECATGKRITIAAVLTAAAGSTTAANNAVKGPGSPTIRYAEVKNTIPDTMVPAAVKTAALTIFFLNFFTIRNNAKNVNAVTGLSMIFGINPPGKVVVNPEIRPVTKPKSKTLRVSGKRIMPKNIMVSIMSGFIPRKKPGTTA